MPTFSPATTKILQLSQTLTASPNEIVAAIRLDPVLTGKVLQLVNSAYFSLAQKITSLNRALVYLGINTIKNLALSTAVMQAFETKNKELADLIRPSWRHSLATAVCTKNIARAANVPANEVEEYFIAGLLHDLGQITMIQAFFTTDPHNGRLTLEEEKARYGVSHNEVGADTLRRWKFSDEWIEAVANYCSPKTGNKLSYFIHIADAMTYRLQLNGDGEAGAPRDIIPDAWSVVGLSEEQVLAELESAHEQIEKAEIFLNIASSKEKVVEQT
ncbi:MAG TPA: HDOD domain-containing protein [Bdellovibrionota bacterium]